MPPLSPSLASLGVLAASICFGVVPYFTKSLTEAGIAPFALAFYRFAAAGLILAPALWWARRHPLALAWGVASGVCLGVGWIGYAVALREVPVSTVAVLYMTYPVFTILLAWLLFGDRPTRHGILASGLILAAAALTSGPQAVEVGQVPYVFAALGAPLGFGFAIAALVHRLQSISPMARIASASWGAILGLAPLVALTPTAEVLPTSQSAWMLVLGLGLITALIPQLIYVTCSPVVGAARSAILGSIELPTMMLVGLLAFGEHLTWIHALSCGLVLWALSLARPRHGPNRP